MIEQDRVLVSGPTPIRPDENQYNAAPWKWAHDTATICLPSRPRRRRFPRSFRIRPSTPPCWRPRPAASSCISTWPRPSPRTRPGPLSPFRRRPPPIPTTRPSFPAHHLLPGARCFTRLRWPCLSATSGPNAGAMAGQRQPSRPRCAHRRRAPAARRPILAERGWRPASIQFRTVLRPGRRPRDRRLRQRHAAEQQPADAAGRNGAARRRHHRGRTHAKRPLHVFYLRLRRGGDWPIRNAAAVSRKTVYGDGNPLAVIDSEMPEILLRLHLRRPGDPLPVPPAMPATCHRLEMRDGVEWCR